MDNGAYEYFISDCLGVNWMLFKAAFYVIGLNRIKVMVMIIIIIIIIII